MKTYNSRFRSGLGLVIISLFIIAIGITGCSDDDVTPSEKQITSFVFLLTENPINVNVIATINESAKTITAIMPEDTELSGLIPAIEVSSGATVSPTAAQNFNNPITYTVTGEAGSTATYTATVTAALSQRDVLQIILDENPGNTLGWVIPNSGDLGSLDSVTTNINGDIIRLNLPQMGLTTLPGEIGQLTALQFLGVSLNSLNSLPGEIGQLTNLKELHASSNSINSIPTEIGQLILLEKLFLGNNNISSLPQSIGNLSNLIRLSVSSNSLTSIPAELGQLTNLTLLFLERNQISSLPLEIFELTGLTDMRFHNNQLTSLPKEVGLLTNLDVLSVSNNQFTSIPPEIGFLSELRILGITDNNLDNIPLAVCNMETFNDLHINMSPGLLCDSSPSELDVLISIYAANPENTLGWRVDTYPEVTFTSGGSPVNITANNKNLVRIPAKIDALTSLEVLNLNSNSFDAAGALTSDIGALSALTTLTLGSTGINTVPNTIGNLSNLTLLSLTNNPITSIPQEVCDLQISNGGILTILTDPGEGCE